MKQSGFNYFYNPQGSSPGTLTIPETAKIPSIVAIEYNGDRYEYQTQLTPEDCAVYLTS